MAKINFEAGELIFNGTCIEDRSYILKWIKKKDLTVNDVLFRKEEDNYKLYARKPLEIIF